MRSRRKREKDRPSVGFRCGRLSACRAYFVLSSFGRSDGGRKGKKKKGMKLYKFSGRRCEERWNDSLPINTGGSQEKGLGEGGGGGGEGAALSEQPNLCNEHITPFTSSPDANLLER